MQSRVLRGICSGASEIPRAARPAWRRAVAAAVVAMAGATVLPAQQAAPRPSDPFVRYTTPGQCEQATYRLMNLYWRDKRPDTLVYAPGTDSLPAPVLAAGRACASRFSVAGVPERDLVDLAQLYILTQQDDLAQAAIDRLLRAQASLPAGQRGWTHYLLGRTLLGARPTRMDAARRHLQQLDALGAPAALYRMLAHTQFADYALTVNDRTTAISEARAALSAGKQMSRTDQLDYVFSTLDAYAELVPPVALERGAAAARALVDTASTALVPLRPPGSQELAQLRARISALRAPYVLLGTKAPKIEANWWYNAGGDTTRPRAGKATIVVFAGPGGAFEMQAVVRRLSARYASRGLDVIVATSTRGYFRSQPMPSAAEEAALTGKYFSEHLKLPAAVAVQETPFSFRPTDGRRLNQQTSNNRNFFRGPSAVLIGADGVVRLVANLSPQMEQVWNSVIEETVQ